MYTQSHTHTHTHTHSHAHTHNTYQHTHAHTPIHTCTHIPRAITWGRTSFVQANSRVWATVCSFLDSVVIPITFLLLCIHIIQLFKVKNCVDTELAKVNLPARQTNNGGVVCIGGGIMSSICHYPLGEKSIPSSNHAQQPVANRYLSISSVFWSAFDTIHSLLHWKFGTLPHTIHVVFGFVHWITHRQKIHGWTTR